MLKLKEYGAMRKRSGDRRWMGVWSEGGKEVRGGTEGEIDKWSEGGIVMGHTADS